jgi:MSHA biogenesis protein MshI
MNWFRGQRKEPGWLVLALGENRLSYVHGRHVSTGRAEISRYGSAEIESRPHAAEKLMRDLHIERYQCATLLRPGEYQLLLVEAPTVPQAELKSAIRWRIKDMLDYHVDDAVMDVLDIPPDSELAGRSHSMFAVAAHSDVIKQRISTFEEARVPLSVIDIPEVAQRNIAALHEIEGRGVALLYFNQEFGLLTISCRGELYMTRRIDIGMKQILGRPGDSREELFSRIVLELQRTFDHFDRQFRYVQVATLLLGPEPEESGLLAHLKGNLDQPVERASLSEHLDFGAGGEPDAETQWQLFHLFGASLRHEAKVL